MDSLVDKYADNSVIRSLIQLIPWGIGGAFDVVVMTTVTRMQEERSRAFFDQLANVKIPLPAEVLASQDFLHCYFATIRYVMNTRRHEKIQMFAKLLGASITTSAVQDVDEYEELLEILDELSFRELQALVIMDSFSDSFRAPGDNDLQWVVRFWDEFEGSLINQLNIRVEEVTDFMNRISRTGCYELFVGGYMSYTGGKGKLTPTYHRLKSFIYDEIKK